MVITKKDYKKWESEIVSKYNKLVPVDGRPTYAIRNKIILVVDPTNNTKLTQKNILLNYFI